MGTFLFDKIIFGPINSRRLGSSLGINLLPEDIKYCNFNCIYCECGWNDKDLMRNIKFHSLKEVINALEEKLKELNSKNAPPNYITFAGNGEPTLHPEFEDIINKTIELRNKHCKDSKIAVLTNSTTLNKSSVANALSRIDRSIFKLDSAMDKTCKLINEPSGSYSVDKIVKQLKLFKGEKVIQSMFVKGSYNNLLIDNSTDEEVKLWLQKIKEIKPNMVMIYTIDRDTPATDLEKVDKTRLDEIAEKVKELDIDVSVSY